MSEAASNAEAVTPPQGVMTAEKRHGWTVWAGVTCVECPSCAFTFDAGHVLTREVGFECPECGRRSHPMTCVICHVNRADDFGSICDPCFDWMQRPWWKQMFGDRKPSWAK
jgi:hypothetical protein